MDVEVQPMHALAASSFVEWEGQLAIPFGEHVLSIELDTTLLEKPNREEGPVQG